ncbi:MAG: caspase family protein, partial [Armatimonadetes bacterium]|nr:caspase family protein [Armatimonadota bacterium]
QQDSTAPFLAIRNARVEFTFGPPTAGPEGRYAILVAVQEYQNFPRLQNPYRDAAKLRTTLLGHGYLAQNIRVITDSPPPAQLGLGTVEVRGADANSLLNAVQAAANDARNKGVQYLTFSFFGHGAWKEGRNYLIPAGVQLAFLDKLSVTPQEVLQVLNGPTAGKPIPHVLLLIDACRSGAGARLNPTPLDPMNGDTVTAYYSCTQGEESLELLQPQQGSLNFTGGLFTEMFTRLVRRGSFKNWGPFEDELYGLVREAAAQLEGRTQRPDRQAVPSGDAKATLPGFFALQDRSPSPMQATR